MCCKQALRWSVEHCRQCKDRKAACRQQCHSDQPPAGFCWQRSGKPPESGEVWGRSQWHWHPPYTIPNSDPDTPLMALQICANKQTGIDLRSPRVGQAVARKGCTNFLFLPLLDSHSLNIEGKNTKKVSFFSFFALLTLPSPILLTIHLMPFFFPWVGGFLHRFLLMIEGHIQHNGVCAAPCSRGAIIETSSR